MASAIGLIAGIIDEISNLTYQPKTKHAIANHIRAKEYLKLLVFYNLSIPIQPTSYCIKTEAILLANQYAAHNKIPNNIVVGMLNAGMLLSFYWNNPDFFADNGGECIKQIITTTAVYLGFRHIGGKLLVQGIKNIATCSGVSEIVTTGITSVKDKLSALLWGGPNDTNEQQPPQPERGCGIM